MTARLEETLSTRPLDVERAVLTRHKPGRRCTIRYEVCHEVGLGGPCFGLFGKAFASDRAPRVWAMAANVAAVQPQELLFSVPHPVACIPDLRLVLQRELSGEPIEERLLNGDLGIARSTAEALFSLHRSSATFDHRHAFADEIGVLAIRSADLCSGRPDLAEASQRCLGRLAKALTTQTRWRWLPVHRDFYHDQILWQEDQLGVLDFDDAALSEPAVDVANFLAHLDLLALQRPAAKGLRSTADAFLERYVALDTAIDEDLVTLLRGATLLRLASIHVSKRDGHRLATELVELAEITLGLGS